MFSFRSEEMAELVWGLGAMAAEYVFYGENTNGVGGDVQSATRQAAQMVGAAAMSPEPVEVLPMRSTRLTKPGARGRIGPAARPSSAPSARRGAVGSPPSPQPFPACAELSPLDAH